MSLPPILLSPPHLGSEEADLVQQAIASNWVAPAGPFIDEFEREFAAYVGARHAVAVSSGTAALHLALHALGIGPGDEVAVSTLTFVGSVGPIVHRGAAPVFIDSAADSWNMDPALLERALDERPGIRAVVTVHLYGQSADLDPIRTLCERRGIPLIEDAAEAAGTRYRDRHVGNDGVIGYFSFNGNKIITASNGGMIVTPDEALAARVRKLATQAREPAPHYEHTELGYNYRLSNILAALGLAQLRKLDLRVAQRRRNFLFYSQQLGNLPGLEFMPEPAWGVSTRWLTVLTIDPERAGTNRESVRELLAGQGIEARPVWKPMHLQPALCHHSAYLSGVSDRLFRDGLCLPSGSSLSEEDLARVTATVRQAWPVSMLSS
ncbi:MAG: DegT/DnrJ/EryC1/StrS family aminotransferase [Vicinamibacterales bacterium]